MGRGEGWKVGRLEGFVLRLSPKGWKEGMVEANQQPQTKEGN
jgi:hypothetical protein